MSSSRIPLDQSSEEYLRTVTVGEPPKLTGPITIADYDPRWPTLFDREADRIRTALGERVIALEHVGSTSVPGLPAKPVIDIDLIVADSADEAAYVPALEDAGYRLNIREPDWYEHRCFQGPDIKLNLHVFGPGAEEHRRHLIFRDWLREHPEDRRRYAATKRELARRNWTYMTQYAAAKGDVVLGILATAGYERPVGDLPPD